MNNQDQSKENMSIVRVWAEDFKSELSDTGSIILDLRTLWELKDTGVIQWAKILDYYSPNFENQLSSLDKDKKYLIYCRSWNRSLSTLYMMSELGFKNVVELEWWLWAWVSAWEKLVSYD